MFIVVYAYISILPVLKVEVKNTRACTNENKRQLCFKFYTIFNNNRIFL